MKSPTPTDKEERCSGKNSGGFHSFREGDGWRTTCYYCGQPRHTPINEEEGWEKEFDGFVFHEEGDFCSDARPRDVRQFIRKTLATNRSHLLSTLRQEVEGMKLKTGDYAAGKALTVENVRIHAAKNAALDTVITLINKLK